MKVLVTMGFFDDSGECRLVEVDLDRGRHETRLSFIPPEPLRLAEKGFTGAAWSGAVGSSTLFVCGSNAVFQVDPRGFDAVDVWHQPCMNDLHHVAVTSEHIARLRDERVDVAIGPVLGAPPLPARSSVRVNLEDVVRHLRAFNELGPRAPWPDRSAANALVRTQYPEYYYDLTTAHEDPGLFAYWMESHCVGETVESVFVRLVAAFPGLVDGVPITRNIPSGGECVVPSIGLARGGNTLILEPRLLGRIPNIVPMFHGRACRRSDMVWARLAAHLEGARFSRAPLLVWQDRTGPGRSGFDEEKLLDDARGSALVRTMDRLISEGMLAAGREFSADAARHAAELFHENLATRVDAIRRSEERAHQLLDEIDACTSIMLENAAFARGRQQLKESVAALRRAMGNSRMSLDTHVDSLAVETFFLGLHADIDAYCRAGG